MGIFLSMIRGLGIGIWSILMISASLVVLLCTWNSRIPVMMARTLWSRGVLWCCGVRLDIDGVAHVDSRQPYVFVANHQSFLDIPLLFRSIPTNLHFVAKKELKKIPFLGWYMMATGMIFIDRSNRVKSIESLKRAAKLVARGKSVIMFPEGTRSLDGRLATFKKGPFMLALDAKVPIIPVGLSIPEGRYSIRRWHRCKVNIAIGEPIPTEGRMAPEIIAETHDAVGTLSGRGTAEAIPV